MINELEKIYESNNPAWEMYQYLKPYFSISESEIYQEDLVQDLYNTYFEPGYPPIECIRKNLVARRWCCAVPSPDILKEISAHSPIIEIGAGNGYWADQLKRLGTDISAYDNGSDYQAKFFDVAEVSKDILIASTNRTLLLVWPSDGLNWAYDLVDQYKWEKIIYIGEWRDGHMATSPFFDTLESDYTVSKVLPMCRYPDWNDSCYFLIRK